MTTLNLRETRERLGLSLQQVSEKTGIHVGNLSRVERGEEWLGHRRLQRLAQALNLPDTQVYAALSACRADKNPQRADKVAPAAP